MATGRHGARPNVGARARYGGLGAEAFPQPATSPPLSRGGLGKLYFFSDYSYRISVGVFSAADNLDLIRVNEPHNSDFNRLRKRKSVDANNH
jgi:hypothetical protein